MIKDRKSGIILNQCFLKPNKTEVACFILSEPRRNHLHLCVIVDVDNIDRSMSVADVKYAVIIRLQHLQKINICPTIDENKVLKLHEKGGGGAKTYHH